MSGVAVPVPEVSQVSEARVAELQSDRLSHFRTQHRFLHYGEFESVAEFIAYRNWAHAHGLPLVIVGNGSNILFGRDEVQTLVLKNRLPRTITPLSDDTLEISSTVAIAPVLKWCGERNLDSFYYLASVPATIGGAIAMNAGRGREHHKSIFDYVQSVTYLDGDEERTVIRDDLPVDYRQTPFTGLTDKLILKAVLTFPPAPANESADAARERVMWSKENQDHSAPNCGSVFKQCNGRIMRRLRGVHFSTAAYSGKTYNWLLNHGQSSRPIVRLITLAQVLHRLFGQKAEVELIRVD